MVDLEDEFLNINSKNNMLANESLKSEELHGTKTNNDS
jgi:hypothetical protein